MASRTAVALLIATMVLLSVAPMPAQDFGAAAKIVVMIGRVSVLKDGIEWARNTGDLVQPRQIIITGSDGYAKLQLADGSTFEVFQNTRVVFRDTPGWSQLLEVLIGRVKVFIEHKNGPNPNKVTTQTAIISVRGTTFDVSVEDEDATTLVSVDEGTVSVQHQRFGGNAVQLQAGESLRVFRDQPLAKVVDKGNAARAVLRAAAQAVYDTLYRRAANGGTSTTGGTSAPSAGGQGDAGKNPKGGGTAPPPPVPGNP